LTKNLRTQELTELSLNELFQNHWTEVYSFAKSKTRNHQKADDLTCETFIKAFLKIESYDSKKQFKNWIFTICNNTFIDNCRKTNNQFSYLEDQLHFEISDTTPSAEDQMILNKEKSDTLREINFLGEDEKQIITLHYLENLSYKEISEKLKITEGNARTRLSRAKRNLKEALKPSN
jgi:RNA polymerase sigma-70 factor (ECF subfamily)